MLNEHTCNYAYPKGKVRVRWKDMLQNYWWQAYCETPY